VRIRFRPRTSGLLTLGACLVLSACSGGGSGPAAEKISRPAATTPAPTPTPAATPSPSSTAADLKPLAQDPDMPWGTPLRTENFVGPLDPALWNTYEAVTKEPYPTSAKNTSVAKGVLRLDGKLDGPTKDRSKYRDQGAGIASTLNQVYGRWEARIKVDPGKGYGVAMTIWPHSNVWPRDGEIDVMESHDAARATLENTIHNGAKNLISIKHIKGRWTGWHVYGVDWEPTYLKYYVDGKLTYTVTDPKLIPRTPMHATLQIGVECSPTWRACHTKSSPKVVRMSVDWVKMFAPAKRG
jgi:hypothetical protein